MDWYRIAMSRLFDCKISKGSIVLLNERREAASPEQAETHCWYKAAREHGSGPNMRIRIHNLKTQGFKFECKEILPPEPPKPPPSKRDPQGYLF